MPAGAGTDHPLPGQGGEQTCRTENEDGPYRPVLETRNGPADNGGIILKHHGWSSCSWDIMQAHWMKAPSESVSRFVDLYNKVGYRGVRGELGPRRNAAIVTKCLKTP